MIYVLLGTRAQLIKMAPVMTELDERGLEYEFVFTGQHEETINDLLRVFRLRYPDIVLYSGREISRISEMISWFPVCLYRALKSIPRRKGVFLVHGDAISALLGAISAKALGYRVGYVEAGLRSGDLLNPFPEEITRILTSELSDYHFCPGERALINSERYRGEKVNTYYNTLLDSLRMFSERMDDVKVDLPNSKYCLASIHRFENIFSKKRMEFIVDTILRVSEIMKVVFVLHKPTRERLLELRLHERLSKSENVELRPRYDYFKFMKLLWHSEFLLTDGGGNQEECFYLGKPCLIMRNRTEREDGIGKNAVLSKYDFMVVERFLEEYETLKSEPLGFDVSPSEIIVDFLERKLNRSM